jgi:hypothetical protein
MAFHSQVHRLLAAVHFLTHAISDHFFSLDHVLHQGDVSIVSDDDIRFIHTLNGPGSHFFPMARSDTDDPDKPRAIDTVVLTNFVFGRSVFPFIDSINAAD